MAIRQYIGARYVPRFVGTYDATQIYDALDVVDNGSGTSYIARKTVPAGTPLTDTDHWFVYGASSGAIIQLQNDMIQAQNDILSINGDISDINDEIDYIEEKGRRIVTLSDSYGNHPSNTTSWQQQLEAIISDATFYNFQLAGIGIYHDNGGVTCQGLLQNNSTNIPDHDTITDIIISMGGNDVGETLANVSNAFSSLITYINTEYPKARIHIAFPNYNNNWNYQNSQLYIEMLQHYIDLCAENNVHFCSGVEYIMHNIKNVESDGVHPNINGAKEIARGIATCLKDGSFLYKASLYTKLKLTGDTGTGINVEMIIDGPTTSIQLGGGSSYSANEFTFLNNSNTKIGEFDDTIIKNGHVGNFCMVSTSDADNPHFMMMTTNGVNFYGLHWGQTSLVLTGISVNQGFIIMPTLSA